jgi:transposase-like protein
MWMTGLSMDGPRPVPQTRFMPEFPRRPEPPHPLDPLLARLRSGRFVKGIHCPRCGSRRTHRWGSFKARQRYRCLSCCRTFSDLTASPAAYIKKLELWPAYAERLSTGASLRRTAADLGIHPTTAFRWRHAILRALDDSDIEALVGWIELASRRFVPSEKGSRHLTRPGRRRGWRPDQRDRPRWGHIVAACDRTGHCVTTCVLPATAGTPDARAIVRVLGNRTMEQPVVLQKTGRFGAAARYLRDRGGTFLDARRTPGYGPRRTLRHVDTASGYLSRYARWMGRFRGVATRYLANYLIWHRIVDRALRQGMGESALRWPVA